MTNARFRVTTDSREPFFAGKTNEVGPTADPNRRLICRDDSEKVFRRQPRIPRESAAPVLAYRAGIAEEQAR